MAAHGAARTRVFVHLDHGRSPDSWTRAYADGRVFEPAPYGYHYAAEYVELAFSVDATEHRAVRFIRRGFAWLLGFDLLHAWRNRAGLRASEVIWTHTEHEHLAVALMKRLGSIGPVPIIGQSIWLWDSWTRLPRWRRGLYRWLLDAVDLHTTHSRLNADFAQSLLGRPVHPVPFGIEPVFDVPPSIVDPRRIRVVAPGNDRDRDWVSLQRAADYDRTLDVRLLSRRRAARRAAAGAAGRVRAARAPQIDLLIAEYARADVVVVPLHPNGHASGLTVALEGLAAGRPVVATRAGGLSDYFGDAVHWAAQHDPKSLVEAIHEAADAGSDPTRRERGRRLIENRGLTIRDYALRHVLLTRTLLGRPGDFSAVSAFRPVESALQGGPAANATGQRPTTFDTRDVHDAVGAKANRIP